MPWFKRMVATQWGLNHQKFCSLISMLKFCLGFLADNTLAGNTKHFIHADILVLVSEFVVVVSGGQCRSLLTTMSTSLMYIQ